MKTWLLCRFGGIGDLMAMTPVAKAITEKHEGDKVDFAVRGKDQIALIKNLPFINKIHEIVKLPDPLQGAPTIKHKDGFLSLEEFKNGYDMPIDFFKIIENNTHHEEAMKMGEWVGTQNSNFVNWIDMHLGWCNIDPKTVGNKSPVYIPEKTELNWAKDLIKDLPGPIIGMNLFASSRSRTQFNPEPFIHEILTEFTGCTILIWKDNVWHLVRAGGSKELVKGATLRKSCAIIKQMDCYVSADSGFSHLAEAMGVPNVTVYTTVPSWTRSGYYKHCIAIDSVVSCSPCFTLHLQCPVNRQRAIESISPREKKILEAANSGLSAQQASVEFSTTPDKIAQELGSIKGRMDGLASVLPDCVASVTPDLITEKIREIIPK